MGRAGPSRSFPTRRTRRSPPTRRSPTAWSWPTSSTRGGDDEQDRDHPPGRWDLPSVKELWEAREVLISFGRRDVLLRYRQTVIGVAWVILQPLAAAGIFAIVFGQVADLPSGDVPYFLFAFASMLAWNLFSGVAGRSASSLVANQSLVSKVFFPACSCRSRRSSRSWSTTPWRSGSSSCCCSSTA
ncbi:ABC transporter permease [Oerskovia sp. M15]